MNEWMNNFQDKVGQIFAKNSAYSTCIDVKLVYIQDEEQFDEEIEPIETVLEKSEIYDYDELTFHGLVDAEVILFVQRVEKKGKDVHRKRDNEGNLVGKYSQNRSHNDVLYEVEFQPGECYEYMGNILAENMTKEYDEEAYSNFLLKGILDHKFSRDAVKKKDAFSLSDWNQPIRKRTTRCWSLLVLQNNG